MIHYNCGGQIKWRGWFIFGRFVCLKCGGFGPYVRQEPFFLEG